MSFKVDIIICVFLFLSAIAVGYFDLSAGAGIMIASAIWRFTAMVDGIDINYKPEEIIDERPADTREV